MAQSRDEQSTSWCSEPWQRWHSVQRSAKRASWALTCAHRRARVLVNANDDIAPRTRALQNTRRRRRRAAAHLTQLAQIELRLLRRAVRAEHSLGADARDNRLAGEARVAAGACVREANGSGMSRRARAHTHTHTHSAEQAYAFFVNAIMPEPPDGIGFAITRVWSPEKRLSGR